MTRCRLARSTRSDRICGQDLRPHAPSLDSRPSCASWPLASCSPALTTAAVSGALRPAVRHPDSATAACYDGSGNPWRRADIGIRGDRIVAVGRLAGATATHGHRREGSRRRAGLHRRALACARGADDAPSCATARALLAQGVTTVVGNPDGGGRRDLKRAARELEADGGVGVNVGAAHRSRAACAARVARASSAAAAIPTRGRSSSGCRRWCGRRVADGAFGLSSGLFYTPGRFAKTEEVIALAREAGGVYTSHIRDEGNYDVGVVASVDEVIRIAEEARRARHRLAHEGARARTAGAMSKTLVEHIEAARARGVEVYADQYPYEASSTSLAAAVMPGESGAGAQGSDGGRRSRAQKFLALVQREHPPARRAGVDRHRVGPRRAELSRQEPRGDRQGARRHARAGGRGHRARRRRVDRVVQHVRGGHRDDHAPALDDGVERRRAVEPAGTVSVRIRANNGAFARRLARLRPRAPGAARSSTRSATMTSLPAQVFGFDGPRRDCAPARSPTS